MCHAYLHVRHQAVEDFLNGTQLLHFVVKEENLASAVEFIIDYALYLFLVEEDNLRLDRDTVWWRGLDY